MKAFLLLALCLTSLTLPSSGADKITIVLSDKAPTLEKIAAQSLATELKLLFALEVSVSNLAPAERIPTLPFRLPSGRHFQTKAMF